MNASNQMKDFEDPLMGRLKGRTRVEKVEEVKTSTERDSRQPGGNTLRNLLIAAAFVTLAVLAFFLIQGRQRLETLNAHLISSQEHLIDVTKQLEQSKDDLGDLRAGLEASQGELGSQQKLLSQSQRLYRDLRSEQGDQKRELETISIKKAEQSDVAALQSETSQLKEGVGQVNTRLGQVNSEIGDLRTQTTSNRTDLETTRTTLESVRGTADTNAKQIAEVKRSLEHEYYNFELQEKGGVMKVFNVALNLKDVDFNKQQYDLEIFADNKRLRKKNQNINEPIYFTVEGASKPYEVLVNRIDKKVVVGYLSVPKVNAAPQASPAAKSAVSSAKTP